MTKKKTLGNAAFYLGNTLIALIFVSPLIWMIASSLKPEAQIFKGLNSLSTFIPRGASLDNYNDFMWPLLVVTGEEKRTIQLAIQTFFGSKPINYGPIMASLTISAIPMLVMFIFLQKYYVEGIASTGIKG